MTGECEMYYDIVMSGDRIRQLRKHEGITQEQLGAR